MYAKNRLRSLGLALLLLACTAGMLLYRIGIWLPVLGGIGFVLLNIFPSVWTAARRPPRRASCVASDGADLLTAFLFLIGLQVIGLIGLAVCRSSGLFSPGWLTPAVFLAADTLVFWNGILRVYLTSPIIGLKWRILGIVCGWIPVANLVVLCRIIRLVRFDTEAERQRAARDLARAADRVCATRYPLLLVHGVFFRDSNRLNYWGRIPEELERNGAVLYYGNQQSALSVADSGRELAERIRTIVRETGCEKVNILAHSKGGLDARYACTALGMSEYIASLTTINTPHRGCAFADWLLEHASPGLQASVARTYNAALRRLGDRSPDFLAAVTDLTAGRCRAFNAAVPDCPGVLYQSTASRINRPLRGVFPLCLTRSFVRLFDGDNDGLVSVSSAAWGERVITLATPAGEGVSHADVIDLPRHNRPDLDIGEFYVGLVRDLKNRGL